MIAATTDWIAILLVLIGLTLRLDYLTGLALDPDDRWGRLFVLEALSVILQVGSFKLNGKRIFKMATLKVR